LPSAISNLQSAIGYSVWGSLASYPAKHEAASPDLTAAPVGLLEQGRQIPCAAQYAGDFNASRYGTIEHDVVPRWKTPAATRATAAAND
jgi:hypothetical protein